jgi:uncharacterized membrane protein YozB (DUF420 family)
MSAVPPQYAIFPVINASLNGTSAVLLFIGHGFIRRGRMALHRAFMIAAVASSSLFLVSYLYYHVYLLYYRLHLGPTHFTGQGFWRVLYLSILISHTILATVIVPLVIITLARGLRGNFPRHRVIARWTYPLWLYVSVTGVVIYFMLYKLFPA